MTEADIWWRLLPSAQKTTDRIVEAVLNRKAVLIQAETFPWPETLRAIVREALNERSGSVGFMDIDANMLESATVLDTLCEQYNGGTGRPLLINSVDSLIKRLPSNRHVCWLHSLSEQQQSESCDIARELAKDKASLSVICETDHPCDSTKNVVVIRCDSSALELQLYAMMCILQTQSAVRKPYIEYASVLIAELAKGSIMRCSRLCGMYMECISSPATVCDWLDDDEVDACVRAAQMKCISPLIEKNRLAMIETLGGRAAAFMPFTDEWGNEYAHASELELRHMVHYYNNGRLRLSTDEATTLKRLYTARNKIAHLEALSPEEVIGLYEMGNAKVG